jgi:hypothetical protein
MHVRGGSPGPERGHHADSAGLKTSDVRERFHGLPLRPPLPGFGEACGISSRVNGISWLAYRFDA